MSEAPTQEHTRAGLCASCAHARRVETRRGSVFLQCLAPERLKYPALPVLHCDAHAAHEEP